jgi:hypothetical protein
MPDTSRTGSGMPASEASARRARGLNSRPRGSAAVWSSPSTRLQNSMPTGSPTRSPRKMGPAAVSTVRVAGRRTAASRRTGPGPRPGHPQSQRASSPAHRPRPFVNSTRSGATPDSPCRPSRCCAGVSDYRSGFEGVPDRMLRSLRIRCASVELRDLALGQMIPGSTSEALGGERPTDLRKQSEAGVLAEPNQHDAPRAPLHVRRTRPGHRRWVAADASLDNAVSMMRARGQAHVRHGRQQAAVRHFTEGDIATHAPHGQTGALVEAIASKARQRL